MNAKYLIAALVTLAAPAWACAQAAPSASGVTRAQVIAEIAQARADGTLPLSEANFLPFQLAAAPAAREQVTAELHRAHANGELCGNEAECDAAPQRDFTVTRAQVLAELYRARAAGEIPETEADNDIGRAALRSRAK